MAICRELVAHLGEEAHVTVPRAWQSLGDSTDFELNDLVVAGICDANGGQIAQDVRRNELAHLSEFEHAMIEADGAVVEEVGGSFVEDLLVDEEDIWSLLLWWCELADRVGGAIVGSGVGCSSCEQALVVAIPEIGEGLRIGVGVARSLSVKSRTLYHNEAVL